jgi:hypothetical protein
MPSKARARVDQKAGAKRRSQKPEDQNLAVQTPQLHPAAILQRAGMEPRSLTPGDVLQLQSTVGNRAVGRLLQRARQRQVLVERQEQTGAIQRKTRDIHIDKRLTWGYKGRLGAWLAPLPPLIRGYNSFPVEDVNYDLHLAQLHAIKDMANGIEKRVDSAGYLLKSKSLRGLGGPFRRDAYLVIRNLRKLAGYAKGGTYEGTVDKEIKKVEKQKKGGLEARV